MTNKQRAEKMLEFLKMHGPLKFEIDYVTSCLDVIERKGMLKAADICEQHTDVAETGIGVDLRQSADELIGMKVY